MLATNALTSALTAPFQHGQRRHDESTIEAEGILVNVSSRNRRKKIDGGVRSDVTRAASERTVYVRMTASLDALRCMY